MMKINNVTRWIARAVVAAIVAALVVNATDALECTRPVLLWVIWWYFFKSELIIEFNDGSRLGWDELDD